MSKEGYVYIMGNEKLTIYIGVTSNLEQRVLLHKSGKIKGFTQRYGLKKLLYFEEYPSIEEAIVREKQLKNWHRDWKINLIKGKNSQLKDLFDPETSSG